MSVPMADALRRHVEVTATILRNAAACGRVVIVTLAKSGWVELSIRNFLPGLGEILEELGIQVIYARYSLPHWKIRCAAFDDLDVLQLMKEVAMRRAVRSFYSKRPNQSWKNVLSIGDSLTERDAMNEVIFCRFQPDQHGHEKPCRCKTIKLLEDPDLLQLTAELEVLTTWIHSLVAYDGDIDLDFSPSEDAMAMLETLQQRPEVFEGSKTSDAQELPSGSVAIGDQA